MNTSPFRPETECERHGLGPNDWRTQAVYAIECHQPDAYPEFRARWYARFEAKPPVELMTAAMDAERVVYVGWANDLLARLHDHAAGDHAPVLFASYPPERVIDVWPGDGIERERQRAYELKRAHPGWFLWCDGSPV